jgi:2-oxoglutarate ferredoxin oxidoreductase subunit alpha
MPINDMVIRMAGESGEGIVTTGEIFARIAATAGLEIYTFRTYPAEILGGPVMFQLRIKNRPVLSHGDVVDVLVAFNQAGWEEHKRELRPGGVLVYDADQCQPPEDFQGLSHPLPLTRLVSEIGFPRGRNIIVIGALVRLFNLPYERAEQTVRRHLGGKEALLLNNLKALDTGYRYVTEHLGTKDPLILQARQGAGAGADERLVMSGNQAIALGALAAGCRFYSGYPITPATDIMEFLAKEMPKVGGAVVQAEDEMAALAMVLGASFAGQRAMTATSGPGLCLMVELLGHASMAEIPAVIVDVQRAGPSTGMPTKTSQGDLALALHGSHDEAPRIVMAPTSVEDCFYQMVNAFNLAELYQLPVIFLSDQSLSHRVQTIPPLRLDRITIRERLRAHPDPQSTGGFARPGLCQRARETRPYQRYEITESGVSPMSLPGDPGGYYIAEGLEHDPTGAPDYAPATHIAMMEKRFRKLKAVEVEMRNWGVMDRFGDSNARVGVIGWGSTAGAVQEAVERARAQEMKVAGLYPKVLQPLPRREIQEFLAGLAAVIVPEANYTGQLADHLATVFEIKPVRLNKYDGLPFTAAEVYDKILQVYEGVEKVDV